MAERGFKRAHRQAHAATVFDLEHKMRWAKHVGTYDLGREVASNYKSADMQLEDIEGTFEEQEAQGMMVRMTYLEAREAYGDRLRIASLGAVPQEGGYRVIHDGTHHVGVNTCIRVRDQEAAPTHDDLKVVLDEELRADGDGLFVFAFDVSKAHRRVGPNFGDLLQAGWKGVPTGSIEGLCPQED